MEKLVSIFVLAVALAACPGQNTGDAGPSGGSSECSPLDGVYQFTYTLRSGTCGAQPDEFVQFNDGVSVPSTSQNCQPGGEQMTTSCELQRQSMCTVSDPISGVLLGTTHISGALTEASDNSGAQGSFDVTITPPSGTSCQSTYAVTATRVQ